ncbi:MupG family TIM beta-alpha barrel fold protein [Paenibacillus hodogayensis]|uniref:MupG family TIM beta-alpha barrel fold protein n=1 Tax=Paenibacillus hodogayensis TaxID=279208 RepID=A0ABV5W702_9BACL
MAELGQSIYPTLGIAEANRQLDEAIRVGCRHLFTSLHLPEASVDDWREVRRLLERAAQAGMRIAADVSRASLAQFDADPEHLAPLAKLGIEIIRLDHGFTMEETMRILRAEQFTFQINAGSMNRDDVRRLEKEGVELSRLIAVHNFYPRRETGVTIDFYRRQNRMFREFCIATGGFVPSLTEPRGPLHEGLPTVEAHRRLRAAEAAAELIAEGLTDIVYFGDPGPNEKEWTAVSHVVSGLIPLRVKWIDPLPPELEPLLADVHTSPWDAAELVIRSPISKPFVRERGFDPVPRNTFERPLGSVTMDNTRYIRYFGEVQVTRTDLPADERVNVLGRVIPEDRPLLRHIGSGMRYAFVAID